MELTLKRQRVVCVVQTCDMDHLVVHSSLCKSRPRRLLVRVSSLAIGLPTRRLLGLSSSSESEWQVDLQVRKLSSEEASADDGANTAEARHATQATLAENQQDSQGEEVEDKSDTSWCPRLL